MSMSSHMLPVLKFKRLSQNAYDLVKFSKFDAGYDLCSAYNYVVPKNGKQLIETDIALELPKGTYGRIASRSGLAWENFIISVAGVIDPGYRGNICVVICNLGNNDFIIRKGDRIAQLICEKFANTVLLESLELSTTERDQNGFGSSDI